MVGEREQADTDGNSCATGSQRGWGQMAEVEIDGDLTVAPSKLCARQAAMRRKTKPAKSNATGSSQTLAWRTKEYQDEAPQE